MRCSSCAAAQAARHAHVSTLPFRQLSVRLHTWKAHLWLAGGRLHAHRACAGLYAGMALHHGCQLVVSGCIPKALPQVVMHPAREEEGDQPGSRSKAELGGSPKQLTQSPEPCLPSPHQQSVSRSLPLPFSPRYTPPPVGEESMCGGWAGGWVVSELACHPFVAICSELNNC